MSRDFQSDKIKKFLTVPTNILISHPLKIGRMFISTYLLGIVHTSSSQNIYYFSWNTLYILTYKINNANMLTGRHLLGSQREGVKWSVDKRSEL
jgi:hypothetical protein